MTKKLSSYQELKTENIKMEQELFLVIRESDCAEASEIRIKYNLLYDLQDSVAIKGLGLDFPFKKEVKEMLNDIRRGDKNDINTKTHEHEHQQVLQSPY